MILAQAVTASTSDIHLVIIEVTAGVIVAILIYIPHIIKKWAKHIAKEVLDEVRPNGGNTKSLGDTALNAKNTAERVEVGVKGLYSRIDSVEEEQQRVRTELAALKLK